MTPPPDLAALAREWMSKHKVDNGYCADWPDREGSLIVLLETVATLSRTAGRAEGLEEAAKWHDSEAAAYQRQFAEEKQKELHSRAAESLALAAEHGRSADRFRALAAPDPASRTRVPRAGEGQVSIRQSDGDVTIDVEVPDENGSNKRIARIAMTAANFKRAVDGAVLEPCNFVFRALASDPAPGDQPCEHPVNERERVIKDRRYTGDDRCGVCGKIGPTESFEDDDAPIEPNAVMRQAAVLHASLVPAPAHPVEPELERLRAIETAAREIAKTEKDSAVGWADREIRAWMNLRATLSTPSPAQPKGETE